MANKKINQLDVKSVVALTDLMIVGDPSSGTSYKTTITDLQTLLGSGVTSFNGRTGAVLPAANDYSISLLSDVVLTSLSNNQILQYNSTTGKWVNVAVPATGITSLGGQTNATQLLATGTSGTQFNIVSTGGIHTFNIPISSGTNTGLLSNTDWTTFNSKQGAITLTTTGNSGAATFVSNTLNIPNYTLAGLGGISLTALSASSPLLYNNTTGVFSIQVANATQDGYLSSTDWNTFNSKGSGTVTNISIVTANGFSGTVANSTTTPAVTLTTTVTGILKGNGTAISSAVANTDYQSPISLTTTGNSGSATFTSNTINIPNYTLTGLGGFANPMTQQGDLIIGSVSGAASSLSIGTAGQLLRVNTGTTSLEYFTPTYLTAAITSLGGQTGATQTFANDTNVTITSATNTHTLGWTGTLSITRGGTGLGTLGTANQLLRVNAGATALEYFTPNYLTSNQTITLSGDVSGSGATAITANLTNASITGKTQVSVATDDLVLISDTSDATNLKKATIQSILNLAGTAVTGNMNAEYSGGVGGTTISTTEVSIGTVTITPQNSTSKIQVVARMVAVKDTGTTRRTVTVRIKRGTTQVGQDCVIFSQNVSATDFGPAVVAVVDTHGSATAITYTIFALCDASNGATSENWEILAIELIGVKGDKGDTGSGVTDGDKTDITVSNSGATWTIDSGAVTYSKIQTLTDNRLLGRSAGTNGTVQEITIGTGLSLSSGTLSSTVNGTVTTLSVVSANGFAGTVANATTTPAITLSTTITGLLKGNGTAISAAVANTDYQSPITLTTSGSSGASTFNGTTLNIPTYTLAGLGGITLTSLSASSPLLYNNTTGVFSIQVANATQNGYLSSTDWTTFNNKGNGTVTSISVVSANGFAGTVATSTTTPAITISTSVTGILKGNGTAISAAVANTDYQSPITLTTTGTSGAATFNGTTLNIPNYGASSGMANPMTTLGDIIYGDTGGTPTRLAGNTTSTKQFLSQTGTGTVSAAPSWATLTKTDVGLGNVENTALSTWAGSTNITTLGTIATGTWNATTIGITKGGTGLTALGTAGQLLRVNTGATALEYFTPAYLTANQSITFTASNDVTGTASGTTSISPSLTVTGIRNNSIPSLPGPVAFLKWGGTSGSNTWLFDTTTYLTSAVTTINFGTTGLTPATATSGAVTVAGTLNVANGGTGATTLTGFAIGNGTSAFTSIALANVAYFASAITGTPSATTYLRGDGSWQTISGSGITSLNTLTAATQTFATGTSGTDFNISSATSTHTFNIPDASGTARGLITTGAQTIAGSKTFSSAPTFSTMTSGSILFASTGGLVSQKNANLFWDNTNNRLGIGTTSPTQLIDARGTNARLEVRSTNSSSNAAFLLYARGASGTESAGGLYYTGNETAASRYFSISADNVSDHLLIFQGGNVTVGTNTNSGFKFDVNGTARFNGVTTISTDAFATNGFQLSPNVGSAYAELNFQNQTSTQGRIWANPQGTVQNTYNQPGSIGYTAISAGTNVWYGSMNNSGGGIRYRASVNGSNHSHIFYENSTEQMRIATSTGNVLIGTATDSTFKLDVNGTARTTGNLTIGTMTAGSILFAGTGGLVSQKNANLFWDDTNNRLGVGTASPVTSVDVPGTIRLSQKTAATSGSNTNSGILQLQNTYWNGTASTENVWTLQHLANTGSNTGGNLEFAPTAQNVDGANYGVIFKSNYSKSFTIANFTNSFTVSSNDTTSTALQVLFGLIINSTAANRGAALQVVEQGIGGRKLCLQPLFGNTVIGGTTDAGFKLDIVGTTRVQGQLTISTGGASITGNVTLADANNIILGTSTGNKIGTATSQKIGFWNATPIVQPTTAVAAATVVANTGTTVNDASTFDGYTIAQVVKALRNTGLLA